MKLLIGAGAMLLALSAVAKAADAADVPAVLSVCQSCHQADGAGNPAFGAPALAGQQQAYLLRQLQHFQSGIRGSHPEDNFGAQMQAALPKQLNQAELNTLAAFFAALPAVAAEAVPVDAQRADRGRKLYINSCGACHGAKAEGVSALNAPALRQLAPAYQLRQLQHFRDGMRGTDANDKPGRQMARMAQTLKSEQDILDILQYIGTLP